MKNEREKNVRNLEPEVVYENKGFLVVNKPAGLLVHGIKVSSIKYQVSGREEERTLVDWILKKYPEVKGVGDEPGMRPGIVHRLDKDTSGVILVARTQEYFDYLKKLFQEHKIKKTYLALVYGCPKEKKGRIDKPIALKPGTTKRTVFGGKMVKEAVTDYELVSSIPPSPRLWRAGKYQVLGDKKNKKTGQEISLLKVFPKTGRTHQIRVHLASIGCPVLNDRIYARKREKIGVGRLMLHALSVEFVSNDGKRIFAESGLPEEFSELVDSE